ncbi:MAG: SpoVG family protein [Planctomycetaceae bacterium]|nr:SpoVG family protein [Planctomycetaceae bacterium]
MRIKLMDDPSDRLKAFCSITFDACFVIRDLKIIEGINGAFVAMPSRKLTAHCPRCRVKNHSKANYCNHCGCRMETPQHNTGESGRSKLYADIAHPINSACREMIQKAVIEAFEEEKIKAQSPGYVSSYDEYGYDYGFDETEPLETFYDQPHKPRAPHHESKPAAKSVPASPSETSFGYGVF